MRHALIIVAFVSAPFSIDTVALQSAWSVNELAEYRLTVQVLKQFGHASRLIAVATRDDPEFVRHPLFTEEIALSGEVQEMASALEARLTREPLLASALGEAGLTAHDYTKFALALSAARLAYGFVQSGALRRVPDGAAADNVKFVGAHLTEVLEVLKAIGLEV
jgi:hypothetical protein